MPRCYSSNLQTREHVDQNRRCCEKNNYGRLPSNVRSVEECESESDEVGRRSWMEWQALASFTSDLTSYYHHHLGSQVLKLHTAICFLLCLVTCGTLKASNLQSLSFRYVYSEYYAVVVEKKQVENA